MNPYSLLTCQSPEPHLALVGLNRPGAANALTTQLALELSDCFRSLPQQPAMRVIVLTGEGKHFCAGADLKERKGMNETQWHAQHHAFEQAMDAILACPIPVIAAVNGAAFGGGLELALACDMIHASETARFALTETTLGIMPGMGGTQQLPRRIGMARAKELIFSGKPFTAQEALQWGLANRLCAPDTLLSDAMACARAIAENAPLAVRAVKQAIYEGAALPMEEALRTELKWYGTLLHTNDRHEGVNAFNEKRKPHFTGT